MIFLIFSETGNFEEDVEGLLYRASRTAVGPHCTHLFHLKMSLESHILLPVLENTEYHFSCYARTGYKMLISFEG
jgi:hypothetical protein